jgi:hypothetical protein
MLKTIKKHYGPVKAGELEAALDNRWTVEFRIADFPRSDGTHNIPFFSKLTLRDEASDQPFWSRNSISGLLHHLRGGNSS